MTNLQALSGQAAFLHPRIALPFGDNSGTVLCKSFWFMCLYGSSSLGNRCSTKRDGCKMPAKTLVVTALSVRMRPHPTAQEDS
jgi:hypothetical protein